jgi:hypothetical protein
VGFLFWWHVTLSAVPVSSLYPFLYFMVSGVVFSFSFWCLWTSYHQLHGLITRDLLFLFFQQLCLLSVSSSNKVF